MGSSHETLGTRVLVGCWLFDQEEGWAGFVAASCLCHLGFSLLDTFAWGGQTRDFEHPLAGWVRPSGRGWIRGLGLGDLRAAGDGRLPSSVKTGLLFLPARLEVLRRDSWPSSCRSRDKIDLLYKAAADTIDSD
jgi:hypothetical protein